MRNRRGRSCGQAPGSCASPSASGKGDTPSRKLYTPRNRRQSPEIFGRLVTQAQSKCRSISNVLKNRQYLDCPAFEAWEKLSTWAHRSPGPEPRSVGGAGPLSESDLEGWNGAGVTVGRHVPAHGGGSSPSNRRLKQDRNVFSGDLQPGQPIRKLRAWQRRLNDRTPRHPSRSDSVGPATR